MAGDNGTDWKKFGIGLTEAVGGIVGGVVGGIFPGTGAPIAMATGGVVKVVDATVPDREGSSAPKATPPAVAAAAAPAPPAAPTEGSDAAKAQEFLIKQGWSPEFVRNVMTKAPAPSSNPPAKTEKDPEIAFWKRLLDDKTLPKELREHYTDKLNQAEKRS